MQFDGRCRLDPRARQGIKNMPNKKKILITGLSGFTGRYLGEIFRERGWDVVGLSNEAGKDTVVCDLRDRDETFRTIEDINPTGVIHLAGVSSPAHEPAIDFYAINTIGTTNLLDALLENANVVEKVVIASSSNVYGRTLDAKITEDSECKPVGHYAASKMAMEHLVSTYYEKLPIVQTRPFNYTGPGQNLNFLIPKIVDHFKREASEIALGNIDVERDFLDVRDVASAYWSIFAGTATSEVVNICSGKVISLKSIIDKLIDITGHKISVVVDPRFVRANDIKSLGGDNTKLSSLYGFSPHYEIEGTLRTMLTA